MDFVPLLIFLAIGAVAGFLAGLFVKGGGSGVLVNTVVGVLGAIIGGYLFGRLGIDLGVSLIGEILTATLGAILLLFLLGILKRAA